MFDSVNCISCYLKICKGITFIGTQCMFSVPCPDVHQHLGNGKSLEISCIIIIVLG